MLRAPHPLHQTPLTQLLAHAFPLPAKIQLPELPWGRGTSECLQLISRPLETPNIPPGFHQSGPAPSSWDILSQHPATPSTLDERGQDTPMPREPQTPPAPWGSIRDEQGCSPQAVPHICCKERCRFHMKGCKCCRGEGQYSPSPGRRRGAEARGQRLFALRCPAASCRDRPSLPTTAPSST